ncbi:hypothetical protein ACFFKU_01040 [Kineococcus gynurae]|uniref:Gluconate 2-dehydrogenase subunit 3-like protein n=1 Tax=Kineococcus gynurae TaxID=452979 RepID=A0ABV5LQ16_9ACTN
MAFPAKYPQLNDTTLTDEAKSVLIRVLRVAFPHEQIPDGPYERTADTILAEAEKSTWFRVALTQGLLTLSHLAGGDFRDLDDEAATSVLKRIETTEFFGFVRRTTVLNFYDNADVWDLLGYEGPSFDKGGYVNRGFDDLDWLPEPRIDTYSGPAEFHDIAPTVPLAGNSPQRSAQGEADTRNQPGATEATMQEVAK